MSIRKTIVVFASVFSTYMAAAVAGSVFFTQLAALVCELIAIVTILLSIFKSENKRYRVNFVLIGVAVLTWTIADTLWAYYTPAFRLRPSENALISAFYFISTFTIFVNIIIYSIYRFRRWSGVQLLTDAFCITFAVLWIVWVLCFEKRPDRLASLLGRGAFQVANIATDLAQIILVSILSISARKGRLPSFLRVVMTVAFVYSLVNLIHYYLYLRGLYIPHALIEAAYIASALGIALGTKMYYSCIQNECNTGGEPYSNTEYRGKSFILLLAPLAVLIFKGFSPMDIAPLILAAVFHRTFSEYIQTAVKNKELLEREKDLNQALEQKISERMRDLEEKNSELILKNEELKYISEHDQLTGLYNRDYFIKKLEEKICGLKNGDKIVLIFWNVDRLKGINDTYGHSIGDRVLVVLAERVMNIKDESALLSRLGGDEFAIAVEGDFNDSDYDEMAKKIMSICEEPVRIGQYSFEVSISVGMSVYPYCASGAEMLLKNADIAMHYAKEWGCGNKVSFYRDINSAVRRRDKISTFLKNADYDREFYLHYQPQFTIADWRVVGAEALLRWDCPQLGRISPSEFIPIAEEENLIIPIGNWVIENAIRQVASWNNSFGTNLKMGINISPKQINQTDFLDTIKASIRDNNAFGGWIDIEITEGVALDDGARTLKMKEFFSSEGISLSLDDFGTGYSSLGYLNMLVFDKIKIAKPLTDKLTTDVSSVKIVSSIITLARSLGVATICEGVETKEQFDILCELGCDQVQGYYFGKPMTPQGFLHSFIMRDYQKRANRCLGAQTTGMLR